LQLFGNALNADAERLLPLLHTNTLSNRLPLLLHRTSITVSVTLAVPVQPLALVAVTV
jgi:hypothetical protein